MIEKISGPFTREEKLERAFYNFEYKTSKPRRISLPPLSEYNHSFDWRARSIFKGESFRAPETYAPESAQNPRRRRAWAETVYRNLRDRVQDDSSKIYRQIFIMDDPVLKEGIAWLESVPGYVGHAQKLRKLQASKQFKLSLYRPAGEYQTEGGPVRPRKTTVPFRYF